MAVAYSLQVNLFGLPDSSGKQGSVLALFTISSVDCVGGPSLQNPVVLQEFSLTYLEDTAPKTTMLIVFLNEGAWSSNFVDVTHSPSRANMLFIF